MADYTLSAKIIADIKSFSDSMNAAAQKVESVTKQISSKVQSIGGTVKSIGDSLSGLGGKFTAVETAAAGFATAGLKKAADSAIDFDTQMRKVGAISGSSEEQLQALRTTALELVATTSLSASEVATAMTDMAAKGRDANQIIADMPGIISAAEASGEDLALVADTVTNICCSNGFCSWHQHGRIGSCNRCHGGCWLAGRTSRYNIAFDVYFYGEAN